VVGVLLSTAVPDTSVTSFPFGSFAVAKAVFTTLPASNIRLVMVYVLLTELEAHLLQGLMGFQ
jgi:hypothetical protein